MRLQGFDAMAQAKAVLQNTVLQIIPQEWKAASTGSHAPHSDVLVLAADAVASTVSRVAEFSDVDSPAPTDSSTQLLQTSYLRLKETARREGCTKCLKENLPRMHKHVVQTALSWKAG
mmetsp:Transcript_27400/g.64903  ORF Transcript_27400/g.64903 Transcript_27400/m.64903 type:complete len:118 (-) Transcript_27400:213-566(-)